MNLTHVAVSCCRRIKQPHAAPWSREFWVAKNLDLNLVVERFVADLV